MQKVDIAIAALGAVALLATGLGIAFYDEINGLTDYHVDATETAFGTEAATDAPGGNLELEYDVPQNVYQADGELTVDWSGSANPALTGAVDITVTLTGPDGTVATSSGTGDFANGRVTLPLVSTVWGSAPEDFAGNDETVADKTLTWDSPLTITVSISGPQGPLPGPLNQDDPTYTVELDGTFHGYAIHTDTPEVENI